MDEWKNARRSGPVQIPRIHTNHRCNINKGSKGQTGAGSLSHDKAGSIPKNNAIIFPTKIVLYKSLVLSVLFYGYERWALQADLERRIQAKSYRRMVGTFSKKHKTNEYA